MDFDKAGYPWRPDIDYRAHPERYRVGRGKQGVLICQPYKGGLVPCWRFKTPKEATASSRAIWGRFRHHLQHDDFVGADMARKFLQMGYTRARRYANYKGGKKYAGPDRRELERGTGDPDKGRSAAIFYENWRRAKRTKSMPKPSRPGRRGTVEDRVAPNHLKRMTKRPKKLSSRQGASVNGNSRRLQRWDRPFAL